MKRLILVFVLLGVGAGEQVLAQGPAGQTPAPAPAPARAVVGTAAGSAPKNIRFDIAIADTGAGAPITKVVTLNVSQGGNGSIRASAPIPGMPVSLPRTVTTRGADGKESTTTQASTPTIALNVDVSNPVVYEDGNIRAMVVIEYQPFVPPPSAAAVSNGTAVRQQPAVVRANAISVFESGNKVVLLQAADPLSDRRTTIEVTATIQR